MAERHTIPVTEDESVVAVHHDAPTADWLVHCHGFLSDKTGSYEYLCERAAEAGYNAVRFDFRGCGEADGAFVDQNLSTRIADLRAVVDYFDPDAYGLYGSSFGGKTALHATPDDDRVEALVTRAPVTFTRSFDEARRVVEMEGEVRFDGEKAIDERFFEDFDRYPFTDVAGRIDVPLAIFHGTDDESVPLTDTLDAIRAVETDVTLQTYADEGHRFSEAALARLQDHALDWLDRVG